MKKFDSCISGLSVLCIIFIFYLSFNEMNNNYIHFVKCCTSISAEYLHFIYYFTFIVLFTVLHLVTLVTFLGIHMFHYDSSSTPTGKYCTFNFINNVIINT